MNATQVLVSLYRTTAGVSTTFSRALGTFTESQLYMHFEEAIYFAFKVIVVYQAVNQRFNLRFPECFRKWIPGDVRMRVESTDPIYGPSRSLILRRSLLILTAREIAWVTAWMKNSPEWSKLQFFLFPLHIVESIDDRGIL